MPVLGKGETHHIVHGEGHTSIVDRVFSNVMESNRIWKESQKQEWELLENGEIKFPIILPPLVKRIIFLKNLHPFEKFTECIKRLN